MIFTTKYAFYVPTYTVISQVALPFCVYTMKGTSGISRDTYIDIPMWLKNGVSSHSNIGHCISLRLQKIVNKSSTLLHIDRPILHLV